MRAAWALTLAALLLGAATPARAQDLKDRFNIRLSLSGLYLAEQQGVPALAGSGAPPADMRTLEAAKMQLAYGDLRAVMDARRLPGGFELHVDARLRLTGQFSKEAAYDGKGQISARGYLGGREYDVRELFAARAGRKVGFKLGRFYVPEADGLKLDGVQLAWRFARKWEGLVFAGGYPNPYSRSLLSDYVAVSVAGGLGVGYRYNRLWGSLAVVGSYLGGPTDGSPLSLDATNTAAAPAAATENTRTWLTWVGFERIASWFDLYHALVLDVAGAAGVQLTRLNVFATFRAGRHVTLRPGYSHLSALAIEMYLASLLQSRADYNLARTITNNLVVSRTARDQARLELEARYKRLTGYVDGRFRLRSIASPGDNPQFVSSMGDAVPRVAYDVTVGARDGGSLAGIRAGLAYTYLADYRAQNHLLTFDLGRGFWNDRFSFDLQVLYARVREQGAGGMAGQCASPPTLPTAATLLAPCWGTRDGHDVEAGLTLTGVPARRWFLLVDYRLAANLTDPRPPLLTHVLFLRVEARY